MAYPAAWQQWASGVLSGIGAPTTPANFDNLWAWSRSESGADVMRWNNPLNTTQPEPGGVDANSARVKRYPSVSTGVRGTVDTLLNGRYPALVQSLRSGVPHTQWSTATQANISTWGTNLAFVHSSSPAPGPAKFDTLPHVSTAPAANDPLGIGAAVSGFGASITKEITGGLEVVLGVLLLLAGFGVLVLMAVKGAAPAAAQAAQLASPAGRAVAVVGAAGRRKPAAAAPAAPKPAPAPATAEPEYRAGGRVLEISPEARRRLAARQRGEAA